MTGSAQNYHTDQGCITIDSLFADAHDLTNMAEDTVTESSANCTNISEEILLMNRTFYRSSELPAEMRFGIHHVVFIAAYSCFFVIAAVGNLTVFITLFRNRNDKSRVNMFIMHLAIADLIVTFIMMPLEIGWHATVEWLAGDTACRILMFFRTFGLYLSSFVLVVISLDRYFAILHPLSLNDADKRGKIMLCFAWLFSAVSSAPQVSINIFTMYGKTRSFKSHQTHH